MDRFTFESYHRMNQRSDLLYLTTNYPSAPISVHECCIIGLPYIGAEMLVVPGSVSAENIALRISYSANLSLVERLCDVFLKSEVSLNS